MPLNCGNGRNDWARLAPSGKEAYGLVKPLAATVVEEIGWVRRLKSLELVTSNPYFLERIDGVSSFVVFVSPSELSQTPRMSMKDALTERFLAISRSTPAVVCKKRGGRPLLGTTNDGGELS